MAPLGDHTNAGLALSHVTRDINHSILELRDCRWCPSWIKLSINTIIICLSL